MDLVPGTLVRSVIRLSRPLGHGGMGLVWVADHLTLRTEVVVKFMSEAIASDPVATARFWHEAAAAAAVKSPHVVQMLDHGFTPNGTAFIVMELLDGEDMSHCLARDPVMPLGELSLIVTQACKALTRCHASGVIHRDIKPDNIFLCSTDDPEPFVKLLDFGVAKLQGGAAGDQGQLRMTQTGVVVGTPYYMSPEQAVGSPPVDHTTDLWSLAVVAYEAMTGRRPFDGLTIGALTVAICADPLPVPSKVNPKLPPSLDAWFARACARDRAARFQGARELNDAFQAAILGVSTESPISVAFEATSVAPNPSRPPPAAVVPSVPPVEGPKPERSFATTTTPTSRSTKPDEPRADAARAAVTSPSASRRSRSRSALPIVAFGAGVLALGVSLGLVLGPRDRPPPSVSAVPPPPPSSLASSAPRPSTSSSPASSDAGWASVSVASAVSSAAHPRPASVRPIASAPAPQSASAPTPSPAPSPAPPPATAPSSSGCDPPYYFDSARNKVFKKECI